MNRRQKKYKEKLAQRKVDSKSPSSFDRKEVAGTSEALRSKATSAKRSKILAWVWPLISFLLGVTLGPVIQQGAFGSLPGPRIRAHLRVERMTNPGRPGCSFYRFSFYNYEPIDYMYANLQFPNPVTSMKIGARPTTVIADDNRRVTFDWSKGWDASGRCAVLDANIAGNPDIRSSVSGTMLEIHSSSKFPAGASIIGLIATTDSENVLAPGTHPKLWTEGAYEFSEFGQIIRKKLPIRIRFMNKTDRDK